MAKEIEITQEFADAFKSIEEESKSIFLTGKAGTGKSTFLNYFVKNTKKNVVVLAPTGVAAINIQGQTIHSFFGFKPWITVSEAEKLAAKKKKNNLFEKIDTIVIDEISMVRADLLDCIDVFLKTILNNFDPFGGKQIVFIGDLYQLPPVVKGDEIEVLKKSYETPYFFSAHAMKEAEFKFTEFTKIYRQKDQEFINLLNKIRNKGLDEKDIEKINSRFFPETEQDYSFITLTTTNDLAEKINKEEIEKIHAKKWVFKSQINGKFDLGALPTANVLELKKGARIMLLVNDILGRWVNGSLGFVNSISETSVEVSLDNGAIIQLTQHTWEMYKFSYDEKNKYMAKESIGAFTQFPIR
ncbi:MAG: AAA family ATPase, partial [Candidatus Diapherotrites archaeon]|nr:AAA family ATPase [Candidatus Diapherotrites archaeon]